ncbi:hypothetical protein SUGI_0836090 [Cryptomeria japonica]|uniref:probable methyltransferase TCM_000168 n=1 Tax=Cryptomeria japonica TaxID=3369 RepID=UPI002414835F|nr:probable methyltransferase TCM_000168 [Cryptomeria japonica]GLJ40532.1 hypothetical protein SUGI_0836090 [Cryptomeria japonica]
MEKVISMNAGDGDSSYAQNSILQKNILLRARLWLEESIRSWKTIFDCETLCIADLGCSSGPNTLFITQIITSEIRNKYAHKGIRVPEFQIFYNDLPSSDFNTLFKLLLAAPPAERSYSVAGVPGSFHTRLFPSRSLHFVHSSNCLNWLSQVPPEIEDKNSKWWNKGRIHISEQGPEGVGDAYFAQYQKDFNGFLRARAKEVVEGGRMFLVLPSRLSADRRQPSHLAFLWETLGFAIKDLVFQGIIEEERLDSFNLPLYSVSEDELRCEIYREGSFTIVGLEVMIGGLGSSTNKLDDNEKGKFMCAQARAVLESLISYHFGERVVEAIFNRYAEILTANIIQVEEYMNQSPITALTLERNVSISTMPTKISCC